MDLPLFVHQQFQNILGQPLFFDLPMDVYDAFFFYSKYLEPCVNSLLLFEVTSFFCGGFNCLVSNEMMS
jgi:hypothetical protein